MHHRFLLLCSFVLYLASCVSAQVNAQQMDGPPAKYFTSHKFTRADTLRGALRPERTSFDVTYYELHLEVNTEARSIEGRVEMDYQVVAPTGRIQLDLFKNLKIKDIQQNGQVLRYERIDNAVFIDLPAEPAAGSRHRMSIRYGGTPVAAKNAPWDGGFVWALDQRDRTWVGVACEGTGASLWWPNKDHLSDEPDSMLVSVTVPKRFFVASNGNLRAEVELDNRYQKRYDWFVSYPINNYNVSLGIGSYVHFDSTYVAFDGEVLDLDYYVLDYNLDKARRQFRQVGPMLAAYEHYLGKYPFWDDGFALIETPYLGMEHQSGIAYGNRYMRGYLGGGLPPGMDWDYIIIHESGHEYFGNSISVADHAEMWIHESFTTYLEALYVEYRYGPKDALRYLAMQRPYIRNEAPIVGPPGVNFDDFAGSDHYYKGAWILHTLRNVLNDDPLFFGMLRSFYQDHQHSIVNTQQVVDYFSRFAERDLTPFFRQYLFHPAVPTLEIREKAGQVEYRWRTDVAGFHVPVGVFIGSEAVRLDPTAAWQPMGGGFSAKDVRVDASRFLVDLEIVK
ncbi:M1 family metallopeptidase [Neolewinella lacunae]|nr:M1 family metallopeptidase [Neolewinella lacunae]MDN3633782.1 M1 family metallopeptidase [Neolewinella lacunae]